MKEDFLYLLPTMILSYLILSKLLKDLKLFAWINETTKRCAITSFTIGGIFLIGIFLLDMIALNSKADNLCLGLFLGITLATMQNIKYPKVK